MLLMDVNDVFNGVFSQLKKYDCSYISYRFQFGNYKLEFSTHQEWNEIYVSQSLINHCALMRVGLQKLALSKTNSGILRWNDVIPISKKEKNTSGIRTEFNIGNGISFGRKVSFFSDYFALASDIKYRDFSRNIILNSTEIRRIMDVLFRTSTIKFFYDSIIGVTSIPLPIKAVISQSIAPMVLV